MKYFVKQITTSLGGEYEVYDSQNNLIYYIDGEIYPFVRNYTIYKNQNEIVFEVKQKVWTWTPVFYMIKNDNIVFEVKKKITFPQHEYKVDALGWKVTGDLYSHNFKVVKDDVIIANIKREWLTIKKYYEVDIFDENNLEYVLALIMMINMALNNS